MEQKSNVRYALESMLKGLCDEFPWLSARFEFQEDWGTYLVSYAPSERIYEDKDALLRMRELENKLQDDYEDDAPLFCIGERLFTLSSDAKKISTTAEWMDASSYKYGSTQDSLTPRACYCLAA